MALEIITNDTTLPASLPLTLVDLDPELVAGPTLYSHWIVRGRILAGNYPKESALIKAIVASSIDTFVCLMTDQELTRQGRHYIDVLKEIAPKLKYTYIHIPIYDGQIAEDGIVCKLVTDIISLFLQGKRIYIHCRGGHGRTGTIVSCLISLLYGLDAHDSLKLCEKLHQCRKDPNLKEVGYKSPETHQQINQVFKIISKLKS